MLNQFRFARLLIILSVLSWCGGCSIEKVQSYGDSCPPAAGSGALDYILIAETISCTAESLNDPASKDTCGDFVQNFQNMHCPSDMPQCSMDLDGKYYCHRDRICAAGQHYNKDEELCENDTIRTCGSELNNCTSLTGWLDGNCVDKKCIATKCKDGYLLDNGVCASNHQCCGPSCVQCDVGEVCLNDECAENCGSELENCNSSCVNLKENSSHCGECNHACDSEIDNLGGADAVQSTKCVESKCRAIECKQGYHRNDETGKCDLDTIDNCSGLKCEKAVNAWESGNCIEGQCVLEACKLGYHLMLDENGSKLCENDRKDCCGDSCKKCEGDLLCNNGECGSDCGDKALCGDRCIDITQDNGNCGACDIKCSVDNKDIGGAGAVQTAACQNKQCRALQCNAGYHLDDEKIVCLKDTILNCGGSSCESQIGWGSGICDKGECKAAQCADNYHVFNNGCEQDTNDACGKPNNKCKAGEVCSNGQCAENCGVGLIKCPIGCTNLDSDINNCGECGKKCEAGVSVKSIACINAECKVLECNPGYHKVGNSCIKDDTSSCNGQDCRKLECWASGACSDGECKATSCETGCHINNNNQCVKDDENNCGGKNCTKLEGVAQAVCKDGECVIVECDSTHHKYTSDGKIICEEDNNEHCGIERKKCNVYNAKNSCVNAKCQFTCNTGYHTYNNSCEEDSLYNCGGHNRKCASLPGWGNGTCTNGECNISTCDSRFYLYNGVCHEIYFERNCNNGRVYCNGNAYLDCDVLGCIPSTAYSYPCDILDTTSMLLGTVYVNCPAKEMCNLTNIDNCIFIEQHP